jgi:hypothetical protein
VRLHVVAGTRVTSSERGKAFLFIAVSVDEMPPDDRERYLDLAVFPEDTPIPESPLQVLWGLTPPEILADRPRSQHSGGALPRTR